MKKPISPELIDNAIKLVFEEKMPLQGNFIFGDRAETTETAKETLDYWKKNCKGQVKIYFIQPYPGSEIYKHSIEKGIIKDKLDFIKNKMAHLNWYNMTDNMSDKEILELKKQIVRLRKKHFKYVIPLKVRKDNKGKKNRYNLLTKCPHCNAKLEYKNCAIDNKKFYTVQVSCRNCFMGYYIVSRLYKLSVDYYDELEFFRKKYLLLRDNFRKNRI